jgi:hypothetical protein
VYFSPLRGLGAPRSAATEDFLAMPEIREAPPCRQCDGVGICFKHRLEQLLRHVLAADFLHGQGGMKLMRLRLKCRGATPEISQLRSGW